MKPDKPEKQEAPRLALPPSATRAEIYEVNRRVQGLFRRGIEKDSAAEARRHLAEDRGLPDDLVQSEGLGYCGEGKTTLVSWARREGLSLEALVDAGLLKRSHYLARQAYREKHGREAEGSEQLSEFFLAECRERDAFYYNFPALETPEGKFKYGCWLTIPLRVRDEQGQMQIAGFQFRSMRPTSEIGKGGRYRSPQRAYAADGTQVIDWQQTLIGLAEQAEQVRTSGRAVLCEGKFDQLAVLLAVSHWPEQERPGVLALAGVSSRGAAGESAQEQAGVLAVLQQMGCRHATLWLDEDESGTRAILGQAPALRRPEYQGTLGVGPRIAALGIHVSVARMADAALAEGRAVKDPGELLVAGGAAAIERVLRGAASRGLISFAAERLEVEMAGAAAGGQLFQRLRLLDRLLPTLGCMPEAVRDAAVRRVAEATGVPAPAVREALAPRVRAGQSQRGRGRARG
jgi:hypothetical protein